jgi:hypothetical protein
MEAADPKVGAVLREMLNRESSEGHCCGFTASLVLLEEAFPEPNREAVGGWMFSSVSD